MGVPPAATAAASGAADAVREGITDTGGRPHDREDYVQPEKWAWEVTALNP